ncbi:MAG TPA: hypothetical protein VEA38_20275, partial [Terriglobales bacterium]|nr:hypothetical protein [Terriglobales bacterium]
MQKYRQLTTIRMKRQTFHLGRFHMVAEMKTYSVREASEAIPCSHTYLYGLIRRKEIPGLGKEKRGKGKKVILTEESIRYVRQKLSEGRRPPMQPTSSPMPTPTPTRVPTSATFTPPPSAALSGDLLDAIVKIREAAKNA